MISDKRTDTACLGRKEAIDWNMDGMRLPGIRPGPQKPFRCGTSFTLIPSVETENFYPPFLKENGCAPPV